MQIFNNNPKIIDNTAVAIGMFDGIHIGHANLIKTAVMFAKENNIKSSVLTFSCDAPASKIITSQDQRNEIFEKMDVDYEIIQDFSDEFKNLTPTEFFNLYLKRAKLVVVGFNFKFGKNRMGDVNFLYDICTKNNIKCEIIRPVKFNGSVVSSTFIRQSISEGNLSLAKSLLGRYYSIDGIVEGGDEIGRLIGFPTANIHPNKDRAIFPNGVYATITNINGEKYQSITNYGGKPTIREGVNIIETYIFDFNKNIYGSKIDVSFVEKLRDIKAFSSVEDLTLQLEKDKARAKEFFKKLPFDIK